MKNFKFLLVAAVVFAVGSAFTTTKKTSDLRYIRNGAEVNPALCSDGSADCYEVYDGEQYLFTQKGTWNGPN